MRIFLVLSRFLGKIVNVVYSIWYLECRPDVHRDQRAEEKTKSKVKIYVFTAENAEFAELKNMFVNDCIITNYNISTFSVSSETSVAILIRHISNILYKFTLI